MCRAKLISYEVNHNINFDLKQKKFLKTEQNDKGTRLNGFSEGKNYNPIAKNIIVIKTFTVFK